MPPPGAHHPKPAPPAPARCGPKCRFLILAAALWAVSALADIPDDPAQVQPLSVGMRAPAFSAQTKDGVQRTFSPEGHIHYTLLSDSRLEAAKAFHVAFHLDDATIAKMKDFGVDLDSTTGEPLHELPVPSVFIIDRTGTIRYVYSNPDFKIRLGADALWAAAAPYASK